MTASAFASGGAVLLTVVLLGRAVDERWVQRCRRRTTDAGASTAPAPPTARIAAGVAGLALPIDAGIAQVVVPAGVIGGPLLALLVAGPVPAALATAAVAAAVARARATSPLRRAEAVDRELPGLLDAVARRLRGGSSIGEAIAGVSPAAGGAAEPGWARLKALAPRIGVGPALDDWVAGCDRPSVRLAAAALGLAAETGGSPARAVDGVAATLRSRQALAEEMKALTSQARASASVIAAAPVFFTGVAAATDGRTTAFFRSAAGATLLAVGLLLDGTGAWWMARLCRAPA